MLCADHEYNGQVCRKCVGFVLFWGENGWAKYPLYHTPCQIHQPRAVLFDVEASDSLRQQPTGLILILGRYGHHVPSYDYNGDGDRISQTVTEGSVTTTTTYVLDITVPLTEVLAETATVSDGVNPPVTQPTVYYWHGLDLIAETDGTSIEYLLTDGLGLVRQVVGSTGSILMAQTFDPYGNRYSYNGPSELLTSAGFTGEDQDENGLLFLRARYYNAAQGRFFQMDPSRMERNGYQYGLSNPIMLVDPSGLDPVIYCGNLPEPLRRKCEWSSDVSYVKAHPYNMGSCYGDPFCLQYGQTIVDRALLLRLWGGRVNSYISPGDNDNPPAWTGPLQNGETRSYVCADIIRDVYETANINIQEMMKRAGLQSTRQNDASRSAEAYNDYLRNIGEFRSGSSFPYYPGEIAILWDAQLYSDYVEGKGNTTLWRPVHEPKR
jgi:RHS repeat-associated protein